MEDTKEIERERYKAGFYPDIEKQSSVLAGRQKMKLTCEQCGHEQEINPAAILGKEGGKRSRRTITLEQQAKMQAARKFTTNQTGGTP